MSDFIKIAKYVWSWYRTEKKYFFLTIIGAFILYNCWLASPIFFKRVIDIATDNGISTDLKAPLMLKAFFMIAAIAIVNNLSWRFIDFFANRFVLRIKRKIFMHSFDYLNYHSYRFFTDNMTGSLIKRINRFIGAMENIFGSLYFEIGSLIYMVVGTCIIIFLQNVYLGIFFVTYIFIFTLVAFYLTRFIIEDRKRFIES